jgi:filamentous hemagglutinin family protein
MKKYLFYFLFLSSSISVVYSAPVVKDHSANVSISQVGKNTTIHAPNNSIINYKSFDVNKNEKVQFIQPDVSSRVLNKIQSVMPSQIDGSLSSNGILYLVNPAGIIFGKDSIIDVGGILASAANITDKNFLDNINKFDSPTGEIVNKGKIISELFARFIGKSVSNFGNIISNNDDVALIATDDELTIGKVDEHCFVIIDKNNESSDESFISSGDIFSLAIQNEGNIDANHVSIQSDNGNAKISGNINAKIDELTGGDICILAKNISLIDSKIDASANDTAGNVYIGGSFQGKGPLPNSVSVDVDSLTTIYAKGYDQGHGGKVIVWSDTITDIQGFINVSSGDYGGNGGFVETSGREQILLAQHPVYTKGVDKAGLWLTDPCVPVPVPYEITDDFLEYTILPSGGDYCGTATHLVISTDFVLVPDSYAYEIKLIGYENISIKNDIICIGGRLKIGSGSHDHDGHIYFNYTGTDGGNYLASNLEFFANGSGVHTNQATVSYPAMAVTNPLILKPYFQNNYSSTPSITFNIKATPSVAPAPNFSIEPIGAMSSGAESSKATVTFNKESTGIGIIRTQVNFTSNDYLSCGEFLIEGSTPLKWPTLRFKKTNIATSVDFSTDNAVEALYITPTAPDKFAVAGSIILPNNPSMSDLGTTLLNGTMEATLGITNNSTLIPTGDSVINVTGGDFTSTFQIGVGAGTGYALDITASGAINISDPLSNISIENLTNLTTDSNSASFSHGIEISGDLSITTVSASTIDFDLLSVGGDVSTNNKNINFTGTTTIGSLGYVSAVGTVATSGAYDVQILGSIRANGTGTFANTGTLTLGAATGNTLRFGDNFTCNGPSALSLSGILTSFNNDKWIYIVPPTTLTNNSSMITTGTTDRIIIDSTIDGGYNLSLTGSSAGLSGKIGSTTSLKKLSFLTDAVTISDNISLATPDTEESIIVDTGNNLYVYNDLIIQDSGKGSLKFNGEIDSSLTTSRDLTIYSTNSSSPGVTLNLIGNTTPLKNLKISNNGTVYTYPTININNDITTSGTIDLYGSKVLASTVTLTSTDNVVTFKGDTNATTSGVEELTIDAGTANIILSNSDTGTTTPLKNVTFTGNQLQLYGDIKTKTSGVDLTFDIPISLTDPYYSTYITDIGTGKIILKQAVSGTVSSSVLEVNAGNESIDIWANIDVRGWINLLSPVTLCNNVEMTSKQIRFVETLNGAYELTATSTGSYNYISFENNIGELVAPHSLILTGREIILPAITNVNTQAGGNAVSINGITVFDTSSAISFTDTGSQGVTFQGDILVPNHHTFTITSPGPLTFAGNIGLLGHYPGAAILDCSDVLTLGSSTTPKTFNFTGGLTIDNNATRVDLGGNIISSADVDIEDPLKLISNSSIVATGQAVTLWQPVTDTTSESLGIGSSGNNVLGVDFQSTVDIGGTLSVYTDAADTGFVNALTTGGIVTNKILSSTSDVTVNGNISSYGINFITLAGSTNWTITGNCNCNNIDASFLTAATVSTSIGGNLSCKDLSVTGVTSHDFTVSGSINAAAVSANTNVVFSALGGGRITGTTNFTNSGGGCVFGNNSTDNLKFDEALDLTNVTTTLNGTINTLNQTMDVGVLQIPANGSGTIDSRSLQSTNGAAVTLQDTINSITTSYGSLAINAGTSTVAFSDTIGVTQPLNTFAATARTITFDTNADTINTNGNTTILTGNTILTAPITTFTEAGSGDISFIGTLNGAVNYTNALVLSAGGDINFQDHVGNSVPLAATTISTAKHVTSTETFKGISITQTAGTGNTTFKNITTTRPTNVNSGNITLTSNGYVKITGTTSATGGPAALLENGTNGGDITLTSVNESIELGETDVSGSNGNTTSTHNGGDSGNITLNPNSTVASHGSMPQFPVGRIALYGNITANGGQGVAAGSYGTVSLNSAGRSVPVNVATIYNSPSGMDLSINAGTFTVGNNEAITIFGDLAIDASQVNMGDITTVGNTVIEANNISIFKHPVGQVIDSGGNLHKNEFVHVFAGGSSQLTGTKSYTGSGNPFYSFGFNLHGHEKQRLQDSLMYDGYPLNLSLDGSNTHMFLILESEDVFVPKMPIVDWDTMEDEEDEEDEEVVALQ